MNKKILKIERIINQNKVYRLTSFVKTTFGDLLVFKNEIDANNYINYLKTFKYNQNNIYKIYNTKTEV